MGGDDDPDASGDDEEHVARAYAAQRLLNDSQVIIDTFNRFVRQNSSGQA